MNFNLNEAIEILERTPETLEYFLTGLSNGWLYCNEGKGTWNTHEVVEHLIQGEKVNWIPRLELILYKGKEMPFLPFDREAHLNNDSKRTIDESLQEFKNLRLQNIAKLKKTIKQPDQLDKQGVHPELGEVKASELLSTWVAHDLTHISQIVRIFAERYRQDVGPWEAYLGVLKK
jgi:hypothetical protein